MYGEKIEDIIYHITSLIETIKVKPGVAAPVAVKFFYYIIICEFNKYYWQMKCIIIVNSINILLANEMYNHL